MIWEKLFSLVSFINILHVIPLCGMTFIESPTSMDNGHNILRTILGNSSNTSYKQYYDQIGTSPYFNWPI